MSITVQAPEGAHFEYETVKTKKGTEDLGEVPILVWDRVDAAVAFYGEEGICNILDGTSVRVSAQSIARRMKATGKFSDDEIAAKQLEFRPGKRVGGASKPENRAAKAAKSASEKVAPDVIEALMKKVISGELSEADLRSLVG